MYSIYVYCVHLVYWWSISTGAAVPELKLELERQGEEVRAEPPCHLRDGSAQQQHQQQHQPTQWHHHHPWPWFERRSCVWIGIARPSRVPSHSSGDFMITHPFIRYIVWGVPNYSHHRIFVILICSPTLSCFVFDLWNLNMYLFLHIIHQWYWGCPCSNGITLFILSQMQVSTWFDGCRHLKPTQIYRGSTTPHKPNFQGTLDKVDLWPKPLVAAQPQIAGESPQGQLVDHQKTFFPTLPLSLTSQSTKCLFIFDRRSIRNQAWSVFQFSPSSRPGDVLVRSVTVVVAVEHFHILGCFRILIEFTMKSTTVLPTYKH